MHATVSSVEVYEDNAGALHLFAFGHDGEIVYAAHYWGCEDQAAADYCGLVVQGIDPVSEGWEGMEPDEAARDFDYVSDAWPIARHVSSDVPDDLGLDPDRAGLAGMRFIQALED